MAATAHLAVDLSDAGARPGVWGPRGTRAARPFDPVELGDLVAVAERGTLDLVVLDETFSIAPDGSTAAYGRLDPAVVAARLGRATRGIGLVAGVAPDVADPATLGRAIAAVDDAGSGRAGWQVGPSSPLPGWDDTEDVERGVVAIGAARHVWDHWAQVGAVPATAISPEGPDRHVRVHDGVHFAVGPRDAVPPPVQGHPPVVVRARSAAALEAAGAVADVVRIRALDAATAAHQRAQVRRAAEAAGRDADEVLVLVDAYVVVGPDAASAASRLDLLVDVEGVCWDDGSLTHVGTAGTLTALIADWVLAGAADGFTCRPSSLRADLHGLVDGVVPGLRDRGVHRRAYPGTTLRETLGLPVRPRRAVPCG